MATPLVSLITPAYNYASFLPETIESVLGQDYPNIEYIVLDDGSTDATPSVLAAYGERLRWETHENIGETETVNKGFRMARGEVIGVLSADDVLLPKAVSTLTKRLTDRSDVLAVYPDWDMIDENGNFMQHVDTLDYRYEEMVRRHHCVPGVGTLFRRSVLDRVAGRDPSFRHIADMEFWFRAGLLGPFERVPETLALYRWHRSSGSASGHSRERANEHLALVRKLFAVPDLPAGVLAVKREAYGSAYYIAALVSGDDYSSLRSRYYFLRAFVSAPRRYVGEYRDRREVVFPYVLGRLYRPLRAAWHVVKRVPRPRLAAPER